MLMTPVLTMVERALGAKAAKVGRREDFRGGASQAIVCWAAARVLPPTDKNLGGGDEGERGGDKNLRGGAKTT